YARLPLSLHDALPIWSARALRESERLRREVIASMLQAEEVERSRIATELHDDTVQVMIASLMAMDRVALVAGRVGAPELQSAVRSEEHTSELQSRFEL